MARSAAGFCLFFCVARLGNECCILRGRRFAAAGPRTSGRSRFKAAFQPLIGIVHFFDASWIAKYTNVSADSEFGYCFRFRVNFWITLFTDSIALVIQRRLGLGHRRGPINLLQVGRHRPAVLVGHISQRGRHQVDDAQLHLRRGVGSPEIVFEGERLRPAKRLAE